MMMKANHEIMGKLNLTPAQQTKLKALTEAFQAKMKEMRGKQGAPGAAGQGAAPADRKAMMEKFRPMVEQYRKDFNAVLTPAQQKQYETLMTEYREKMKKERGLGGPGGPGTPGAAGKAGKGGKGGKNGGTKPPVS